VLNRFASLTLAAVVVSGVITHAAPENVPNDVAAVEHALSRLTFGARDGDVERIRRTGLGAWIEQQLADGDDPALEARLPVADSQPDAFASPREARRFGRRQVATLASAKLLRAVYSERQLEELLVDFWFNHFNVFAGKGRTALYVTDYEQSVIRPHVFGRFRDLLGATAKSPAMLLYLDNWQSVAPGTTAVLRNRATRPRGLNENYGRELLELHTLGVDAGYTQEDVVNVARAFTGWTIDVRSGRFRFARQRHDKDAKLVLGQAFPAGGGVDEGERVLDMLATHPATARHVATKLARRFVADEPPAELIARVAARFTETRGDLREVVRTIVTSPEFFAESVRRAKVKTPFEFVASTVRAAGVEVTAAEPMLRTLQQMGMAPYMCQPPTGYADTADAWASSGALVNRINFATQIANGDLRGVAAPPADAPQQLALRLSAPEFQRR
jgi:uncharacterized protein (DUF1800 family)